MKEERWLIRRFTLVFCALVGVFGQPASIRAQTTELDRFVGRDLWKNRLPASEQARLNGVVGRVPKGVMMEPEPWHVWKTSRNGLGRYIVLLGEPEMIVPGGSSACVLLFDGASKRISSWCFQTGWRISLDSASFEFSTDLASDVSRATRRPRTSRTIASVEPGSLPGGRAGQNPFGYFVADPPKRPPRALGFIARDQSPRVYRVRSP
jgi:hypothetical protein